MHFALAVQPTARGEDGVQALLVHLRLTRCPDDARHGMVRLPVLELPGRVAPVRRPRLAYRDDLAVATHRVEQRGVDAEALRHPGGRQRV